MNEAIRSMLAAYQCRSGQDYENALKEIVQEVALAGLWRAKFFEHAAFYGGSALRILHGLDRFSEDLDFFLLRPDPSFTLDRYLSAIETEIGSFGFTATVQTVTKSTPTPIRSAIIKANTRKSLLTIQVPREIVERMHREAALKIKIEIDVDPPGDFTTEARMLLLPIPYTVLTYRLPDLFAGKMHALLYRQRQYNPKGRDWYDLVWYVGRSIPLGLRHLKARLVQSANWDRKRDCTRSDVVEMLEKRIEATDFDAVKADVIRFVRDTDTVRLWSRPFFHEVAEKLIADR